jgi:hypothetical protein
VPLFFPKTRMLPSEPELRSSPCRLRPPEPPVFVPHCETAPAGQSFPAGQQRVRPVQVKESFPEGSSPQDEAVLPVFFPQVLPVLPAHEASVHSDQPGASSDQPDGRSDPEDVFSALALQPGQRYAQQEMRFFAAPAWSASGK